MTELSFSDVHMILELISINLQKRCDFFKEFHTELLSGTYRSSVHPLLIIWRSYSSASLVLIMV